MGHFDGFCLVMVAEQGVWRNLIQRQELKIVASVPRVVGRDQRETDRNAVEEGVRETVSCATPALDCAV